jgi:hypothetical protein
MVHAKEKSRQEHWFQAVIQHRRQIAYGLFVLSLVLIIFPIWRAVQGDSDALMGFAFDWDHWPEWVGGIVVALIALAAGLWLLLAQAEEVNETNIRIAILTVGGLTGLVIALITVARVWLWRSELIFGGIQSWRANFGWLVLCIVIELLGLGLMFVSLLLARSEERSNVVLRRLLYGYNAVLSGLLLLAILVVANILVYVLYPANYQWTKTRALYDLSPRTKNILTHLREPVHVYLIMSQRDPFYDDTRTLLENIQGATDRLQVTKIFPDIQEKDLEALKKRFPNQDVRRGMLVVYGNPTSEGKSLATFIPTQRLYAQEPTRGARQATDTLAYNGEEVLMREITFLKEGRNKPKIYFTQQNQELRLHDLRQGSASGIGLLQHHLMLDNFAVAGLRLVDSGPEAKPDPQTVVATEVPKDAAVVVIARPLAPFSSQQINALRRYLDKKGKLLVLLSLAMAGDQVVAPPTGLEKLLADYNIEVGASYVLRDVKLEVRQGEIVSKEDPLEVRVDAPEESNNGIARAMAGRPMSFQWVRPVKGLARGGKRKVDVLLEVSPDENVWVESHLQTSVQPQPYLNSLGDATRRAKRVREPIPVAAAVSDTQDEQPRMVVIGQAWLATNDAQLSSAEIERRSSPTYYYFLENCLEWLLGRGEKLGIPPQKSDLFQLNPANFDQARRSRMRFLPAWMMAIAIVSLGAGIWVVRRR